MSADRTVHDWLLRVRPEDANHNPEECSHCTETPEQEETEVADGDNTIFTQEQHELLLASAVERASTAARAEADAEVITLNEQLTAATQTITERDATIEALRASIAEREEKDRLDALAEERAAQVKEVANFSDEQVSKRMADWAKMSDETFSVYLEDIREAASAKGDKDKAGDTKFDGTRESAGITGSEKSVIKDFFADASVVGAAQA